MGAWALTRVEPALLQLAVGIVVLAGAAVQWRGAGSERMSREPGGAPVAELGVALPRVR